MTWRADGVDWGEIERRSDQLYRDAAKVRGFDFVETADSLRRVGDRLHEINVQNHRFLHHMRTAMPAVAHEIGIMDADAKRTVTAAEFFRAAARHQDEIMRLIGWDAIKAGPLTSG